MGTKTVLWQTSEALGHLRKGCHGQLFLISTLKCLNSTHCFIFLTFLIGLFSSLLCTPIPEIISQKNVCVFSIGKKMKDVICRYSYKEGNYRIILLHGLTLDLTHLLTVTTGRMHSGARILH